MNKTDLINVVAAEAGLSKKDAEAAVNALEELLQRDVY